MFPPTNRLLIFFIGPTSPLFVPRIVPFPSPLSFSSKFQAFSVSLFYAGLSSMMPASPPPDVRLLRSMMSLATFPSRCDLFSDRCALCCFRPLLHLAVCLLHSCTISARSFGTGPTFIAAPASPFPFFPLRFHSLLFSSFGSGI